MRAWWLPVLLLAGCASDPGEDSQAMGLPRTTEPFPGVSWNQTGQFVVDYTLLAQECATGDRGSLYSRSASTLKVRRPENATRLDVTFSWTPSGTWGERMRFVVVDAQGRDTDVEVEGSSPLAFQLDRAALNQTTPDPLLAGEPEPCGQLPAGVGASPDLQVSYSAAWS